MKMNFELLHATMRKEIMHLTEYCKVEAELIERCFSTAVRYWDEIKTWLKKYSFESEYEEIYFFKKVKPKFVSVIEYNAHRYHSLLFKPEGGRQHIVSFWEHELERIRIFFESHSEFYHYYNTGKSDMDARYFLRSGFTPGGSQRARLYDEDAGVSTSHDYLIARFHAYADYSCYVVTQLEEL